MYKKLFALFMLLSIAVVFTGCGGNSNSSDGLVTTMKVQVPMKILKDISMESARASMVASPSALIPTALLTINDVEFSNWVYANNDKNVLIFSKVLYFNGPEADKLRNPRTIVKFCYGDNKASDSLDYPGFTDSKGNLNLFDNMIINEHGEAYYNNGARGPFANGYEKQVRTTEIENKTGTVVNVKFLDENKIPLDVIIDEHNGWEIVVTGNKVDRIETVSAGDNETNKYLTFERTAIGVYTVTVNREKIKSATFDDVTIRINKFNYTLEGKSKTFSVIE